MVIPDPDIGPPNDMLTPPPGIDVTFERELGR